MERQHSAPFIQRLTFNLISKESPKEFRQKISNVAQFNKKADNILNDRFIFNKMPQRDSLGPMNYPKLTPIQEKMRTLLTNLINCQAYPASYQPPSPKLNSHLNEHSVRASIHKDKVIRKKEEIFNMMGGYLAHNKGKSKRYMSPSSSNSGRNMVMNGIQREVNQILGNMNKITNAQPEYLRYPKTANDHTFLQSRKAERSNSNHSLISAITTKINSYALNKSSSTSKLNYSSATNYLNCTPTTSCPYHNDRLIQMKLGLTSL